MILGAGKNLIWLTIACLACLPDTVVEHDLDREVRGTLTEEMWSIWDESSKYNQCLRHQVSVMREIASRSLTVEPLLRSYVSWTRSLRECDSTYNISPEEAARRRDQVATAMETAIGETVPLYLFFARSDTDGVSEERQEERLETWRTFAIVSIAGVADAIPID